MKQLRSHINYGKTCISFEVLFSNRKTMEIAVHPDGRVVVKAPERIGMEMVRARVARRARWVQKQVEYFRRFDPRTPPRQYVGGESHLYLGRRYRLKIRQGGSPGVKLKGGYFYVTVNGNASAGAVKQQMDRWYGDKAREWLSALLNDHLPAFERMGLPAPGLSIRQMKTRWGSLSARGTMTLNLDLIRAPRACIAYVIVHELCHLVHRRHDAAFYKLLEKHMPDWEKRKHRLEMALR
ncbi:MAG: SprT family zinc-dependent metalloprotease [Thermodesulfobacteriota bacterium]|nr:SprT family zinc-dependent metalloprotease [Thermodesulfobacteriota bacterium]